MVGFGIILEVQLAWFVDGLVVGGGEREEVMKMN